MTAETILYIVIAAVISFALAIIMYGYKSKHSTSLRWIFGIFRFVTLFAVLLLLINPKFKSETYTIEKPKLPVLIDNSESIGELGRIQSSTAVINTLQKNEDLNAKFDLAFYTFGSDFTVADSISYQQKNTNIAKALLETAEVYSEEMAPTVLISDGNQTLGADYEYMSTTYPNAIYPVILGDSTQYADLRIEQLNTNRYAFLKNQFPVEAMVVYAGTGSVNTQFTISQGTTVVYREILSFTEEANTKTLSLTLPATSVGLQTYSATVLPLDNEKNTVNNTKRFAVEVIDEATNVLVVSSLVHPDLGALKKAIETNQQRSVRFAKPSEAVSLLNEYQLILLYQPTRVFAQVYAEIDKLKKNTLTLAGAKTDWNFLNSVQSTFRKDVTGQTEVVSPVFNVNYGTFAVSDLGFSNFPPLATSFGDLSVTVPHEVVLFQSIAGFTTENPLLATTELNGKREAIWDVEGIWKWRAQNYLQDGSFEAFDAFVGKLVQYLASNKRKSRLEVSHESFYYNNMPIKISAQYFDQNYVFDNRASLNISVVHTETEVRTVFPMLLKNNFYEVDVNSLPAGEYRFTVSVADEAIARSGSFTILEFNVEQQFSNANVTKLRRTATNTEGTAFFATQVDDLIETLLKDQRYQSIQKSEASVVPLIDWKYLLAIIVLSLSAEWFIRKYNGLI